MNENLAVTTESVTYDHLFVAGSGIPVVTEAITLIAGQNLARGTVLGKITKAVGTIAAGEENTGDAAIEAATLAAGAMVGVYKIVCITAATGADKSDAVFAVYAPNGARLADHKQSVDYAGGHLAFKVGALAETATAVGDLYTIDVVAGSGKFTAVNSANVDGSQEPYCVLTQATDATLAEQETVGYMTGEFNGNKLVYGGTDTEAMHKDALRKLGIFIKTAMPA